MDGAEFFFEGVRRLDWGLGNPNKTAAMLAGLMVAVWSLAYIQKRLFWLSASLFTVLGGCLVLTFSRGGLVACIAGVTVLIVLAPRPWPRQNVIMVAFSVLVIVVFVVRFGACRRYTQSFIAEDRSVINRVALWKAAPVMISDAPWGWDSGNAGRAYMQWYQPLDRHERYRTLVNSHLTWLVEFGWPLRFLYVFGWLAVLLLCGMGAGKMWLSVPLGIWTTFGTAAFFSSVAESPWLWAVPLISLFAVLVVRMRLRRWPSLMSLMWLAVASTLFCVGLWIIGQLADSQIKGGGDRICIGSGAPGTWLVADEKALGGEGFAKVLREKLAVCQAHCGIGIVWAFDSLPKNISGAKVVVVGEPEGLTPEKMAEVATSASRLILLAPGFYPSEAGFDSNMREVSDVIFGEFSQSPFLMSWEETTHVYRVFGAGDYFPDWPDILCGPFDLK